MGYSKIKKFIATISSIMSTQLKWLTATLITSLIMAGTSIFVTLTYNKITGSTNETKPIKQDYTKEIKSVNVNLNKLVACCNSNAKIPFYTESGKEIDSLKRHLLELTSKYDSLIKSNKVVQEQNNEKPEILISSPIGISKYNTQLNLIHIKGSIVSKNDIQKVTINGKDATITGTSFSETITLDSDTTNITIEAVDKAGKKDIKSFKVKSKEENVPFIPIGWPSNQVWNKPNDILGKIYYVQVTNNLYIWTTKINRDNKSVELILNSSYQGREEGTIYKEKNTLDYGKNIEVKTEDGTFLIKLEKIAKAGKELIFKPYAAWYRIQKVEYIISSDITGK